MDPRHVLVVDAHVKGPRFAAPRWFPEGESYECVRVAHGETALDDGRFTHLILSGSPHSIVDDPPFVPPLEAAVRSAHARGVPIFGICYGSQLLARALLGADHVRRNARGLEAGWLPIQVVSEAGGWFRGLPRPFHSWQYHQDEVCELPDDFTLLASTDHCTTQAWWSEERKLFGTQFHPELDAEEGNALFRLSRKALEREGLDADALIAKTRDDLSRVVIRRFLERDW